MLTRSILIAATATAVSAAVFPGHHAIKRVVEPRQTGIPELPELPDLGDIPGLPSCVSPLLELAKSAPTPPPELQDVQLGDPCGPVTFPPKVAPAASSYLSAASSWFNENSADLLSAISACPQFASLAEDSLASITDSFCDSTALPGGDDDKPTATGSSAPTETGDDHGDHSDHEGHSTGAAPTGSTAPTGTGGGAAVTTSSQSAFAARETGFAGAAIAAAGFLGAVALL